MWTNEISYLCVYNKISKENMNGGSQDYVSKFWIMNRNKYVENLG